MSKSRLILRAFVFGPVAEAIAMALSFGLFSLSYRREPGDDLFSWTGMMIQSPSIQLSELFARRIGEELVDWGLWGFIFVVQSALWTLVLYIVLYLRARKRCS